MAWNEFNAETLFPGPTQAVLEQTGDAAKDVADAAEVIAGGLDTIADFLSAIPEEPLAVIALLKNLIEDALSTGLYLYHDIPSLPLYSKPSFSYEAMKSEMNIDGEEEDGGEQHADHRIPANHSRPPDWFPDHPGRSGS